MANFALTATARSAALGKTAQRSAADVVSFVDYWGMRGRTLQSDPALLRAKFNGAPAPRFRLELNGAEARVAR
jgi:hypothetical protein